MVEEKDPVFVKSHCAAKPENDHFRVPTHFANDRLTFENFPPPPPLLHPVKYVFAKSSSVSNAGSRIKFRITFPDSHC